jgi:formiminoglutamase
LKSKGYTARDRIQALDATEKIDAALIGLPYRGGSRWWQGTNETPDALRECLSDYATSDAGSQVDISDLRIADMGDVRIHMTDARRSHRAIEDTLSELYRSNQDFIPILVGGDHAVAAPSFRAYTTAHDEKLGLIDFDAHNDLRDPAVEGAEAASTPFRQLIDGGFVRGRNATQIGLHGFLSSPTLKDYADQKGLLMVSARLARTLGIQKVLDDALERASSGTDGIYVSLDIDVMDPAFVLGTNSPCSGGLAPEAILDAVHRLGASPLVRALDIVEVDPLKDLKGMSLRLAAMILLSFLSGVRERLDEKRERSDRDQGGQ